MHEAQPWRSWLKAKGGWRESDFWRETFAWSGSATPHILPRVAVFGLISVAITATSSPREALPVGPHEVAGAVLGLFLVLRTNAGYDRWWEARRLWGGIVNQSRNLAVQALSYGPADPAWRAEVIRWTIAFAHASRRELRGERTVPELAVLLGGESSARIARAGHMPGAVALGIGRLLRQAHEGGEMSGFAFHQAERERAALLDHLGGCERILKTPLARVYSVKIRRFIFLFLVSLNFAMLYKFESNWLVPPFIMLVAYPVLSLDLIGVELQNPFSTRNLGHLPLDDICETVETNLTALLAEEAGDEAERWPGRPPTARAPVGLAFSDPLR